MTDCNKKIGKCPPKYKSISSENFGDGKRVTSDLLFQFCKNDSYLYDQVMQLWDKTDPETRKRFYPPYFMDSAKSYGIDPINITELDNANEDRAKFGRLNDAYHLSNINTERYTVDFDYTNDNTRKVKDGNNYVLEINNDNIIEENSTLHVVAQETGTDENPNITYSILPIPVSNDVSDEIPFKTYTTTKKTTTKTTTTKEKTTTKVDVYGKLTLDANCSGPYKNWHNNSVWYIGYNRHKNYNVKNAWKKNPDSTSIPSVCRAQTFKAEHTGELRKVVLPMKGSGKSVSPCIVEIRSVGKNGKPTANVLARTEQKFNHSTKSMVNFTFKKPCKVKKGTQYAIVIRSPLSNFNHCYWIAGWASTCFSNSRKRAYYNGETFLSEDNGKTWILHGSKEKSYGSHYYDWGFAEAPVNFGFEVYIAPKTGTKSKSTTKTIPKTTTTTTTTTTSTDHEYTATVTLNYYEKGDYYLEFKPFLGNYYTALTCIYNIDNAQAGYYGEYSWEIYDMVNGEWTSFDDYNYKASTQTTTAGGDKNFRINFSQALTYIKVRLKLTLNGNILADVDENLNAISEELQNIAELNGEKSGSAITNWINKVYDEFQWEGNNRTPLQIRQLRSLHFDLSKKPSFKGYLRTLEYHPVQEGMLPACIWSEVDVDGVAKNDGECRIDIVHEKTAINRVLLYKADNMDLRPYIIDFRVQKGTDEATLTNAYLTGDEIKDFIIFEDNETKYNVEFIEYLKNQSPKVYILPYTYMNINEEETIYLFGDSEFANIEMDDYLAYPVNSCSIGTEDVHLNIKEAVEDRTLTKHNFTYETDGNTLTSNNEYIKYEHSDDLTDKVKGVSIIYHYINNEIDGDKEIEVRELVENEDYEIEENMVIFNVNKTYEGLSDYPLLHDILDISGTNITIKDTGPINTSEENDSWQTEIIIEMKSYDYNEFKDYIVDYDTKTFQFYYPLKMPEGELKINYNPLWCRNLSVSDFPLKMDLWAEHWMAALDSEGAMYFQRCTINECGQIVPPELVNDSYDGWHDEIITKVAPLDNIRKLEVQDIEGNKLTDIDMVEDIDYYVDYIAKTINFVTPEQKSEGIVSNKLNDGDIIMVKYTPNLTDNGLSLAYRLSRPVYTASNSVVSEGFVMSNSGDVRTDELYGDDFFILSNYFTTRT